MEEEKRGMKGRGEKGRGRNEKVRERGECCSEQVKLRRLRAKISNVSSVFYTEAAGKQKVRKFYSLFSGRQHIDAKHEQP